MSRRVVISLAVLALVRAASPAHAQGLTTLSTGARVRVAVAEAYLQKPWTRHRQWLRGTVARVSPDTVFLAVPGAQGLLSVPRGEILQLAVSRGAPSRPVSAIEQGVASAIVLGAFAALWNDEARRRFTGGDYSRGEVVQRSAVYGLVVGGITGAIFPVERWKRIRHF